MVLKYFFKNKGSLTVEASIVLPLFICVILTIGFFIRIVHTHEVIQYAIDEAANEIASTSYIYYSSGFFDIERGIKDETKSDFEDSFDKESSNAGMEDIGEIISEVEKLLETAGDSNNSLQELFEIIKNIEEDSLKEAVKSVAQEGKKEIYNYVKFQVGNIIAKNQVKKHLLTSNNMDLQKRLEQLHIVNHNDDNSGDILGQLYGLDFSRSRYLQGNDEIDIIVTYKVDLPLPLDFIGEIPMLQRATSRAWLGGSDTYNTDDGIDEVNDVTVYITRTGECYHKEGCYHLRKSKIPVQLSEILRENEYRPCSHCYGKD